MNSGSLWSAFSFITFTFFKNLSKVILMLLLRVIDLAAKCGLMDSSVIVNGSMKISSPESSSELKKMYDASDSA
jgi:hypothetical protein